MKKTAVIAVSTGCLDYLDIAPENLFIVRCKIIMGGESYDDYVDMDADSFYRAIKSDSDLVPTSSMPSTGEMLETFETIEKAGYEAVIFNTISTALSATYQNAQVARESYEGELEIHLVDTKNAAISEGFLTLEALRLIEAGEAPDTIVPYLERLALSRKQYFMVDNLRLLVKNGRLSGASGFMGRILKIKPILEVNDEGKIVPFERIRTRKRALDRMVELILEDLKTLDHVVLTYDTSDNQEGYEYVRGKIEEVHPDIPAYAAPITPVIGAHTGQGTVGVAYFDLASAKPPK